jgi:hypothetical protein
MEEDAESLPKTAKKEKRDSQKQDIGPVVPCIYEEAQDLEPAEVLHKRTRSGKTAESSQSLPAQPSIPKKKRKHAVRKLKVADYVMEEEEQIEATTNLLTIEVKRKKAEDAATLQKALELAKEIEVPASSIVRKDAGAIAQEVIKATEEVQEMVAIEAGSWC